MQDRKPEPEIIDAEYEVLEGEPAGPVIDAEPTPHQAPPIPKVDPGAAGAFLGGVVGEVLKTPAGKVAAIGAGLYFGVKAYKDEQRKKKKRKKKVKRAVRKFRRRL